MTLPPCPYVLEDSGYWLCGQDRTPPQLVKASSGADLPDPASEQNPGNTSEEEKKKRSYHSHSLQSGWSTDLERNQIHLRKEALLFANDLRSQTLA